VHPPDRPAIGCPPWRTPAAAVPRRGARADGCRPGRTRVRRRSRGIPARVPPGGMWHRRSARPCRHADCAGRFRLSPCTCRRGKRPSGPAEGPGRGEVARRRVGRPRVRRRCRGTPPGHRGSGAGTACQAVESDLAGSVECAAGARWTMQRVRPWRMDYRFDVPGRIASKRSMAAWPRARASAAGWTGGTGASA